MVKCKNNKKENAGKLIEQCYTRLENSMALIKLIYESSNINKGNKIALNMVLSDIKSTIEIILEIQDNI